MNEKFFALPEEKQQRIINAAYQVFSKNSYKKAPMSEIADAGDISKALLFHYFTNKKEFYLYLWNQAVEMTRESIRAYHVLETRDFFEMLRRSLLAKCALMRKYPHMYAFSLNAYYEEEPEIKEAIGESYFNVSQLSEDIVFEKMDCSVFRTDIDLKMMYMEILNAVDGYMLKKYRLKQVKPDEIEQEMMKMISFWKTVYTKKEERE